MLMLQPNIAKSMRAFRYNGLAHALPVWSAQAISRSLSGWLGIKNGEKWDLRHFVLSPAEGVLKYYTANNSRQTQLGRPRVQTERVPLRGPSDGGWGEEPSSPTLPDADSPPGTSSPWGADGFTSQGVLLQVR